MMGSNEMICIKLAHCKGSKKFLLSSVRLHDLVNTLQLSGQDLETPTVHHKQTSSPRVHYTQGSSPSGNQNNPSKEVQCNPSITYHLLT